MVCRSVYLQIANVCFFWKLKSLELLDESPKNVSSALGLVLDIMKKTRIKMGKNIIGNKLKEYDDNGEDNNHIQPYKMYCSSRRYNENVVRCFINCPGVRYAEHLIPQPQHQACDVKVCP